MGVGAEGGWIVPNMTIYPLAGQLAHIFGSFPP